MENRLGNELFERFTKNNQYLEALNEFEKELKYSSDRGLVLVCGSIIDLLLSELLKVSLIKSDSVEKDLFKIGGVLATFDSKIKMAYYLGLISKNEQMNIIYMQRIRNKFAHQFNGISFENNAIVNVCNNFEIPKNCYVPKLVPFPNKETGELPQLDLNPIKNDTSAKDRFVFTFNYIYYNLCTRIVWGEFESREEYKKALTADDTLLMQIQGIEDILNRYENNLIEAQNVVFERQDRLDKIKKNVNDKGIQDIQVIKEIQEIQDDINEEVTKIKQMEKEYEAHSQFFTVQLKVLRYSNEVLRKSIKK
ncbi:MltR family transcriptional regulator [Bacillus mycoides]|uniref:MltR family transcriptional regulator n=1 Tax=Bacillus mycoides TaxID=1405 RepID=UPI0028531891|nr:MltR family transcriptional regulator [Bacillus mycoides]MDR4903074.1 MltR family transcriptional regulator [Bacillus mycoides]